MSDSVRLTVNLRDKIESRIMNPKVKEVADKVEEIRDSFFKEIYEKAYPKELREAMKKIPKEYKKKTSALDVPISSDRYCGVVYAKSKDPNVKVEVFSQYLCHISTKDRERANEVKNEIEKLEKELREIRTEVRAILNSCTTTKKLIEVWSEIKDIVVEEANLTIMNKQLPAKIITEDLNKKLNLKKK